MSYYGNWTEQQLTRQMSQHERTIEGFDHAIRELNGLRQMHVEANEEIMRELKQRSCEHSDFTEDQNGCRECTECGLPFDPATCQHARIEMQPSIAEEGYVPFCLDCETELTNLSAWEHRLNEEEREFLLYAIRAHAMEGPAPDKKNFGFFKLAYALECAVNLLRTNILDGFDKGKADQTLRNIYMICGDPRPAAIPAGQKKTGKKGGRK